nr:MAG TPA: AAA domain protein [Caudoviricetes sp.]
MAIPKRPSAAAFPAVAPTQKAAPVAAQTVDGWDDCKRGHFIGLHGTGGAGKSTLAAMLPGKTLFIDLEGSLKIIKPKLAAMWLLDRITPKFIKYDPKAPAAAWNDLMAFLASDAVKGYDNIVIDSFTRAQEWAAQNCIESIPGDSATIRKSLEQWMYGKGAQLVFDKFAPIYPLIDELVDGGTNVLAIAHSEPTRFTNADGADYWQNQPRLVQGEKGKAPGRSTFLEKTDHLLYLAADVTVEKGKASGGMTRTLYTGGLATMMAKSRTVQGCAFDVPNWDETNAALFDWAQIIK